MKRALVLVALLAACGKPSPSAAPDASAPASAPSAPTPAPTPAAAPIPFTGLSSGPFEFTVDGKPADVATRADDVRDPSGNYQAARKRLVIAAYGDAPGAVRRGFLTLVVDGFTGATGEYPAQLRFARAVDATATAEVRYLTEPARASVTITSFEPGTAPGLWRASGTFSAPAAALDPASRSAQTAVTISDGSFDNLLVHGLGN